MTFVPGNVSYDEIFCAMPSTQPCAFPPNPCVMTVTPAEFALGERNKHAANTSIVHTPALIEFNVMSTRVFSCRLGRDCARCLLPASGKRSRCNQRYANPKSN